MCHFQIPKCKQLFLTYSYERQFLLIVFTIWRHIRNKNKEINLLFCFCYSFNHLYLGLNDIGRFSSWLNTIIKWLVSRTVFCHFCLGKPDIIRTKGRLRGFFSRASEKMKTKPQRDQMETLPSVYFRESNPGASCYEECFEAIWVKRRKKLNGATKYSQKKVCHDVG